MEQLPFYLQLIFGHPGNADISLILLVGAGRFERPTPCAQGIGTHKYRKSISVMYSMGWFHIVYSQDRVM